MSVSIESGDLDDNDIGASEVVGSVDIVNLSCYPRIEIMQGTKYMEVGTLAYAD